MNTEAILALVAKELSLLPILIDAGEGVLDTIARLRSIAERAANKEPVGDDELATLESELDAAIVKFNQPMA